MADTTVCHDLPTCFANQDYLYSCCAPRPDVPAVNCKSGKGNQCPYLFTQLPIAVRFRRRFNLALPLANDGQAVLRLNRLQGHACLRGMLLLCTKKVQAARGSLTR